MMASANEDSANDAFANEASANLASANDACANDGDHKEHRGAQPANGAKVLRKTAASKPVRTTTA
jgi:hypothetical protein